MKKTYTSMFGLIKTSLVFALCMALFTACAGGGTEETDDIGSIDAGSSIENVSSGEVAPGASTQEGDTPSEAPKMLYGEISEVIGNALIVKEIAMPDMTRFTEGEMPNIARFAEGEMPEAFTLPDGTTIPVGEDGRPDMSGVDMSAFSGFASRESMGRGEGEGAFSGEGGGFAMEGAFTGEGGGTARQMRAAEREYTGEEVEIIIPVGVPLMTRVRSEDGFDESEVALSNVKSGDILTITYKEDGKSIDTAYISQNGTAGGFIMPGGSDTVFFSRAGGGGDGETVTFSIQAAPLN